MDSNRSIRILLVDDSPAFLESAARRLALEDRFQVVGRSPSGADAIRQVEALRPDLVLMDLAMPNMDGIETTRRIKQQPHPPRVVILTLHDIPEYRAAAESARADGFVSKVDFSTQLPPLILSLFRETALEPTEQKEKMKRILIVDDSSTMRRMIMTCLRQIGRVTFEQASSGLEAIECLALNEIDLMILDLNMPDMHGFEVLRFVRGHEAYRHIPIVVVTTRGDENSRSDALATGASAYMTKPFEPATLVKTVQQLLGTQ